MYYSNVKYGRLTPCRFIVRRKGCVYRLLLLIKLVVCWQSQMANFPCRKYVREDQPDTNVKVYHSSLAVVQTQLPYYTLPHIPLNIQLNYKHMSGYNVRTTLQTLFELLNSVCVGQNSVNTGTLNSVLVTLRPTALHIVALLSCQLGFISCITFTFGLIVFFFSFF